MKLTNPTDAELDAAFAEHVAGWMWRPERGGAWFLKSEDEDPYQWVRIVDAKGADIGISGLRFTQYADAVLPWLEKKRDEGRRIGCEMGFKLWRIWIHEKGADGLYASTLESPPDGESETFSRACVIALLRIHGVQVEFTT